LAFYYPGTEIGVSARGFEWRRLGGDGVTLYTTRPSQDSALLAAAGRALREAVRRTGFAAPRVVEIHAYPDVESFRDATGEPGWVAAYSHGARIEMQPLHDAEKTLRHEMLHILVEAQSASELPLWFREGLVEYLADPTQASGVWRIPPDGDLRQTADAARARRADADAAAEVAMLAKRYGEGEVLRWVKSGIPSSAISPPANSK
jgi:stage II sporulation protein D